MSPEDRLLLALIAFVGLLVVAFIGWFKASDAMTRDGALTAVAKIAVIVVGGVVVPLSYGRVMDKLPIPPEDQLHFVIAFLALIAVGLLVVAFIDWFKASALYTLGVAFIGWFKASPQYTLERAEKGKKRFYATYERWRGRGWSLTAVATATAKVTAIAVCLVVLILSYDLVMDKLRGRPDYCDAKNRHALRDICEETNGIWPFT